MTTAAISSCFRRSSGGKVYRTYIAFICR